MRRWKLILATIVAVMVIVPVAATAATSLFEDVPDNNIFANDINWMKDAGVTKGCNPPLNTKYCPGSNVTREQMAAFMHRLAANRVVDAGTVEGKTASELKGQKGDTGPAGPAGPAGATGATGPKGETGPQGGVLGFYTNVLVEVIPANTWDNLMVANCLPGDVATGGAAITLDGRPTGSSGPATNLLFSDAGQVPNGWVGYYEGNEFAETTIQVRVVCADMTP